MARTNRGVCSSCVRPPPATQFKGAALLVVPLALLMLSHPVPWVAFNICLAGAYIPEALARPGQAAATLALLALALGMVEVLRP